MNSISDNPWGAVSAALENYTASIKALDSPLNSQRIFHGRGGCFADLEWCVIDDYAPVFLVILFAEPPTLFLNYLVGLYRTQKAKLPGRWRCMVVQHRYIKPIKTDWLEGCCEQQAYATRDKLRFIVQFERQNTGFFLDIEPGRQWLEQRVHKKSVLNLFSYTCAFSVVALHAGAERVVNVDMSRSALQQGKANHQINNLASKKAEFLPLNILKSWSRIRKRGPYDLIVVDPPSYQKGSFVAERDYVKVIKRLDELAAPGCEVLLCLNAPELPIDFLLKLMSQNMPHWTFQQRLKLSATYCDVDDNKKLKLLCFTNNLAIK